MGFQEKASKAFYNALKRGKTSVSNSHKEDAEGLMAEMKEFVEASEDKESVHLPEYTEKQEKRRQKYRERVVRKIDGNNTNFEASGEKDDMTREQKDMIIADLSEKGCRLEVIKYELRNGVLPITPCKKRDNGNSTVWPMVGSMKCVSCRYFKGRCRVTREVICSFCYKK